MKSLMWYIYLNPQKVTSVKCNNHISMIHYVQFDIMCKHLFIWICEKLTLINETCSEKYIQYILC